MVRSPNRNFDGILILVKHSLPEIDPNFPAPVWRLSEEGRRRCIPLAKALAAYLPALAYTSREPKAIETGQIVAERLGLSCTSVDDLHEHSRLTAPYTSRFEFEHNVSRFFAEPDNLVFGEETAVQAATRFSNAVKGLMVRHPQETLIIFSHGTVISLFYQSVLGQDPYPFWKKLGLPSYLMYKLPGFELSEVCANIG